MSAPAISAIVDARLARLQPVIERHDLDALLLSSFESVSHFGGISLFTQLLVPDRTAFVVVGRERSPSLIVCDIEESLVRTQTPLADVGVYVEFAEHPGAEVARQLGADVRRLGVEARRLPIATADLLRRNGSAELVAVDDDVEAASTIKEDAEVALLEAAARATQEAIQHGLRSSRSGMTERAVAAAITANLVERGGSPVFLVFGAGARSLLAHAEATERALVDGDVIRIDAGVRFEFGVLGDLARTAVVGEPSARQEEVLAAVRAAQEATFELVEPGRPARDLFRRCKEEVEGAGLPFAMPHIGHGLGVALHEAPHIHPANATPLAAGMVLNIEPLVILRDLDEAYHIEDLVAVTDNGPRLLSTPQDNLLRVEDR